MAGRLLCVNPCSLDTAETSYIHTQHPSLTANNTHTAPCTTHPSPCTLHSNPKPRVHDQVTASVRATNAQGAPLCKCSLSPGDGALATAVGPGVLRIFRWVFGGVLVVLVWSANGVLVECWWSAGGVLVVCWFCAGCIGVE